MKTTLFTVSVCVCVYLCQNLASVGHFRQVGCRSQVTGVNQSRGLQYSHAQVMPPAVQYV